MEKEQTKVTSGIHIEKKVRLNKREMVKYQLIHHCFMRKVVLNDTQLNCLAFLGEVGKIRLTEFSARASKSGILGSQIAVTNYIAALAKLGFVLKEGEGKKKIQLHPDLGIHSDGTVVVTINLIKLDEADKVAEGSRKNSRAAELAV